MNYNNNEIPYQLNSNHDFPPFHQNANAEYGSSPNSNPSNDFVRNSDFLGLQQMMVEMRNQLTALTAVRPQMMLAQPQVMQ